MSNRPLISWLIGTSIIGVAAATLLPSAQPAIDAARTRRCQSNQRTIATYAVLFQDTHGRQRVRVSEIAVFVGIDPSNLRCPDADDGSDVDASYRIGRGGSCVECRVRETHGRSGPGCR